MSVLACDRNGCENVMCNRLSTNCRYYLCDECFEELVFVGPIKISVFLDSEKGNSGDKEGWRELCERQFPKTY